VKEYYNRDNIIVRTATKQDAEYLKDKLKSSDVDEIWASHHYTPEQGLREALEKSIFALTIQNGNPIAMFGIVPDSILGNSASVWFLSSTDLYKIRKRFLRNNKKFIKLMQEFYPTLYNYVDARNVKTIEWLKFCGAKFSEPKPYGVEGKDFRHFYFPTGGR
jgi:hypothetical protein